MCVSEEKDSNLVWKGILIGRGVNAGNGPIYRVLKGKKVYLLIVRGFVDIDFRPKRCIRSDRVVPSPPGAFGRRGVEDGGCDTRRDPED